jgi:hypothetical protein
MRARVRLQVESLFGLCVDDLHEELSQPYGTPHRQREEAMLPLVMQGLCLGVRVVVLWCLWNT